MMKTSITIVCLFCVFVITRVVLAGDETNRFHGATHDGYARSAFYQTESDPELPMARFKGTSSDGYAKSILEDTPVWVSGGTVLMVR